MAEQLVEPNQTECPVLPDYHKALCSNYVAISDFIKEYRRELCDHLHQKKLIDERQKALMKAEKSEKEAESVASEILDYLIETSKDKKNVCREFMTILDQQKSEWGKDVARKIREDLEPKQDENSRSDAFICPFCSKCSLNQYFKTDGGCPEKAKSESLMKFPYIDVSQMSTRDRDAFIARLKSETKLILLKFSDFCNEFIKSLKVRVIPLEDIKCSILGLKPFLDGFAVKLLDSTDEKKIKDTSTISDVFIILHDYISFFNYQIIQQLVKHHGSEEDTQKLQVYTRELYIFCKRNVFEVPTKIFAVSFPSTSKTLIFKCTHDVNTLNDVRDIKERVAEILNLHPAALQLLSIEKGCVELHFLISEDVALNVFPLSPSQTIVLSKLGIKKFPLIGKQPSAKQRAETEKLMDDSISDRDRIKFSYYSSLVQYSQLKPGDHIYVGRSMYQHHGIYVGTNKEGEHMVVHFKDDGKTLAEKNRTAVVHKTTIDKFLSDAKELYRVTYDVSLIDCLTKRADTTQMKKVLSAEDVVNRAESIADKPGQWEEYGLITNNCEVFCIFCKTGILPKCYKPDLHENMEEYETPLATAKVKSLSLIDAMMKALGAWESTVEQYRTGAIDIEEANRSFKKFSETLEKSRRTLQKDLSKSSLSSSSSKDSQDSSVYLELPGQPSVQESQDKNSLDHLRRHMKKPLPSDQKITLNLPSEKLRIDFGWTLNEVADYLSKRDCLKIVHAEQLPRSMITPDSDEFGTILLHSLQGRGRFSPLEPDGLITMLTKLKKFEAVELVKNYKHGQRYKEEVKKYKKQKKKLPKTKRGIPVPKNMEEYETLLATAKVKSLSLIDAVMKALGAWESTVEQYRTGAIDIEEVNRSFRKFSETLEKSGHTIQKDLSTSSFSSSSSEASQDISLEDSQDSSVYSELPGQSPVQKSLSRDKDFPDLLRRHMKPFSLPHARTMPLPTTQRSKSTSPPSTLLHTTDADDFTGGTGDSTSGVGSRDSDRMVWIKNSSIMQEESAFKMAAPKPKSGHYTPLLVRRKSEDSYTPLTRAPNKND